MVRSNRNGWVISRPRSSPRLHDADLFRMLVPSDLGGLGLTIPEAVAVYERVAALDASTGWTLAILASGPVFARNLSSEAFATICQ